MFQCAPGPVNRIVTIDHDTGCGYFFLFLLSSNNWSILTSENYCEDSYITELNRKKKHSFFFFYLYTHITSVISAGDFIWSSLSWSTLVYVERAVHPQHTFFAHSAARLWKVGRKIQTILWALQPGTTGTSPQLLGFVWAAAAFRWISRIFFFWTRYFYPISHQPGNKSGVSFFLSLFCRCLFKDVAEWNYISNISETRWLSTCDGGQVQCQCQNWLENFHRKSLLRSGFLFFFFNVFTFFFFIAKPVFMAQKQTLQWLF